MKKLFLILFLLVPAVASAQLGNPDMPHTRYSVVEDGKEPMQQLELSTVFVFPNNRKGRQMQKQYERLIRAIRVTYPIATTAKYKLREMENKLAHLEKSQQRKYVKGVEQELKKEYTPILKQMSMYQGMVLLKLIDRQTGDTSYELVKELRGSFSAFFWQGIARLFGANLKSEYDKDGDDKVMEELVRMYEQGQI
ncbi:MAG: DUF4294 domain-containing protein [Rikenellaceae bacterium]